MKERKVSVRNKEKEVDVKHGNLKKTRVKKTPKVSLHKDSEVVQKGRNNKKKRKIQTKNRNKQQESNRRYKEGEEANASQETVTKGKKQESYLVRSPAGTAGREGQTYFVLVLAGQFEHRWKKLKQKGTKNKRLLIGLRIWRRSHHSTEQAKLNPTEIHKYLDYPGRGISYWFSYTENQYGMHTK